MQTAEIPHDRAADHDVMKMRDDEVCIVYVNVNAKGSQKQTGHSADDKEPDKAKRVEHRRVV